MTNPGQHAASDGNWRPPDLIASLAYAKAATLEENTERAGQLYMLAELLTALHRAAETLEQTNRTLEALYALVRAGLTPPKSGG